MGPLLNDTSWARQAFLISGASRYLDIVDQQNRTVSSAQFKFTDTALGGNFAINPPAQFTKYADLKPQNISRLSAGKGMGRYYSEAIDDNSQIIYMRFGVPKFNSLTQFFTSFYNTGAGQLARTGRAMGAFYLIGRAAGFVVSVMNWRIIGLQLLGIMGRFVLEKPSSRFYYLKPTMPIYWNMVQTIVNQWAVNRGIVPRLAGSDAQAKLGDQYQFDDAAKANLHALLPSIFNKDGSIDVYAAATRAQRLQRLQMKVLQQAYNADQFDLTQKIQQIFGSSISDPGATDHLTYMSRWVGIQMGSPQQPGTDPNVPSGNDAIESVDNTEAGNRGFLEFLGAEMDDGGAFAGFRVNATGPVAESFSSQVVESELAQKLNSISSESRSKVFDFAGGNIAGGAFGAVIQGIGSAIHDTVTGVMDSLNVSGLASLAGSAFVDIPKRWDSSQAQMNRSTYTINLVSPYGNPISQLMNLYVPLAMLLAGALPRSTGKQSYTSPFILELYDKGRAQVRLGMIDSLTITRGTGNTGFSKDGHALGIEVQFSVVDLSSVLHLPITQGFDFSNTETGINLGTGAGAIGGGILGAGAAGVPGAAAGAAGGAAAGAVVGGALGAGVDLAANVVKSVNGIFDEDTVFTDYMAVLAGMEVTDQIYGWRKFKNNLTKVMTNWETWLSPAHFASFVGDTTPMRTVSAVFKGTARR